MLVRCTYRPHLRFVEPPVVPDPAAGGGGGSGQQPAPAAEPPVEGAEALGEPGKKALDTMKQERNAERERRQQIEAEHAALKAQIEGRDVEHKAEVERQRIRDDALKVANDRILKAEIRVAAAGKLADPADALLHINLTEFAVSADGEVDTAAIAAAIDQLITTKPYLAAQGGRFQGAGDGGARNDTGKPTQIGEAELAQMTPEQINTARREGRLDRLMGRTT